VSIPEFHPVALGGVDRHAGGQRRRSRPGRPLGCLRGCQAPARARRSRTVYWSR